LRQFSGRRQSGNGHRATGGAIKSCGIGQFAGEGALEAIRRQEPKQPGRLPSFQPYSYGAVFRDINALATTGNSVMNSESVAGVLGAIVASIVLVIAIAYGPIGQFGKPAKPAKVEQPVNAAPAVRGPVIREVPQ
jgi:hypothetical protein